MCPAGLTAMTLVATGGSAAGGLALLAVKALQASNVAKKRPPR